MNAEMTDAALYQHLGQLEGDQLAKFVTEHRDALRGAEPALVAAVDEYIEAARCRAEYDRLVARRERIDQQHQKWQRDAESFRRRYAHRPELQEPEPVADALPEAETVQSLSLAQRMAAAWRKHRKVAA